VPKGRLRLLPDIENTTLGVENIAVIPLGSIGQFIVQVPRDSRAITPRR
jgi:hypothetical protein